MCVLQVSGLVRVNHEAVGEVIFMNPVDMMLEDCTLTFSGSGLWKGEQEYK